MNLTAAAELLYDSETTLRMVDEVLDELRSNKSDEMMIQQELVACGGSAAADHRLDQQRIDAFWQIQDALEVLRAARRQSESLRPVTPPPGRDGHARANELLDRLEGLPSDAPVDLRRQLQRELREALSDGPAPEPTSSNAADLAPVLADIEVRLARLGRLLAR